jgi:uncharacterized protein DUF6200
LSDWSEVETAKGLTTMAASPATVTGRSDSSPRPANTSTISPPIVLDLGKQRRKRVKELRRGEGRLMDEVNASIEELRTAGALAADAQPVVVIVREKRRKTRLPGLLR